MIDWAVRTRLPPTRLSIETLKLPLENILFRKYKLTSKLLCRFTEKRNSYAGNFISFKKIARLS